MKKLALMLLSLTILSACGDNSKEMVSLGEGVARDSLKDPNSAQFKSIYVSSTDDSGFVCGKINAKNGYGGYVGFKNYYVYISESDGKVKEHGPVKIIEPDDDKGNENFNSICKGYSG